MVSKGTKARGNDHAEVPPRARKIRPEHVREAAKIYQWLVLRKELAGDLTWSIAKAIEDPSERSTANYDLQQIALNLAAATFRGSKVAVWRGYQHHFIGRANRADFFSRLRTVTRRIAAGWLPEVTQEAPSPDGLFELWDVSLLPTTAAGHVLRLGMLHPEVLEKFLVRFFEQASDRYADESTFRRSVRILTNVGLYGWSAEKHAAVLTKCGLLKKVDNASEVETVQKFIRDMRARYRKWESTKAQLKQKQGDIRHEE